MGGFPPKPIDIAGTCQASGRGATFPAMALISIRAYAARHGVTPAAIYLAIDAGSIERRGRGLIDDDQADAIWGRRHRQNHEGRERTADAEARRERAELQSVVARIQMTRRKTAQLRARLVDRDAEQAKISRIISGLNEGLLAMRGDPDPVVREAAELVMADLGDLHAEALRMLKTED